VHTTAFTATEAALALAAADADVAAKAEIVVASGDGLLSNTKTTSARTAGFQEG